MVSSKLKKKLSMEEPALLPLVVLQWKKKKQGTALFDQRRKLNTKEPGSQPWEVSQLRKRKLVTALFDQRRKLNTKELALVPWVALPPRKKKTGHGIVRSEERAQHQGAGFATMGSLATEKEAVGHGIIAPGAKIKEGPADVSSTDMQEGIKVRQEAKYDSSRADKAKKWLEDVLKETFAEETLQEALKNGVRLCNALNLVYPGSIPKINTKDTVYMQRENLDKYVKACARLGFNKSLLFDVPDLYDGKNMTKVVENIYELAHFGSRKSGLPKLEDETASS
jgi:hypothetical protein